RRALREDAVPAAGFARDRRQGPDRGGRRLYRDLFVGRLQRLSAAAAIRDLISASSLCAGARREGRKGRPLPAKRGEVFIWAARSDRRPGCRAAGSPAFSRSPALLAL